jgi:2-methylcitrate dehydratase PrpD
MHDRHGMSSLRPPAVQTPRRGLAPGAPAPMSARRVAEVVGSLTWETLPEAVRHRARLALRDTLGVMLAGRHTDAARTAARACRLDGGSGPVEVLAAGARGGRITAALANAVAASSLDFDDGHVLGGSIHPGAAIVPALLSCGAGEDLTVAHFLEALVVGYEVAIRAGYLLWPPDRSHQAHLAGTPAAIGGAVACAKLLGLPADGIRRALEIGWAHAPIARLQFPMVKESLGWASAAAVGSALLASSGFKSGPSEAAPFGQGQHPPTGFDLPTAGDEQFVTSLGTIWEIENTYFKPYAACRFTHTAADAILRLFADRAPAAPEILEIVVRTHREAVYLGGRRPTTIEEAQYSFPWVIAAVALDGCVGPAQMGKERLADAALLDLAARVRVAHDPELDGAYPLAYPSRVTVSLRGDRTLACEVRTALGAPDHPMSERQLEEKFMGLAEPELAARARLLSDLVMDGEAQPLVALLALLSPDRTWPTRTADAEARTEAGDGGTDLVGHG